MSLLSYYILFFLILFLLIYIILLYFRYIWWFLLLQWIIFLIIWITLEIESIMGWPEITEFTDLSIFNTNWVALIIWLVCYSIVGSIVAIILEIVSFIKKWKWFKKKSSHFSWTKFSMLIYGITFITIVLPIIIVDIIDSTWNPLWDVYATFLGYLFTGVILWICIDGIRYILRISDE